MMFLQEMSKVSRPYAAGSGLHAARHIKLNRNLQAASQVLSMTCPVEFYQNYILNDHR